LDATTAQRAVFEVGHLQTIGFEQAAGHGVPAAEVGARTDALRVSDQVVELEGGLLTTARMRDLEVVLEERISTLSRASDRDIPAPAVARAVTQVEERLGDSLTAEQQSAIQVLTGPQRAAVLIGQAGTGKGVVLDASARSEAESGREVFGVAVAGRTAQQLGEASPALQGRVSTLDAFVNRVERGQIEIGARTTVYVDEAGMGDTTRLARLTEVVADRGGAVVLIGDARQLPAIGAGGMFARLTDLAPTAELSDVKRTSDPAEQVAWRALRDGNPALAMAHYRDRGDLHFAATRAEAAEAAVRRYVGLAREHGYEHVALMTDASNQEVLALNLRVQHLRHEAGELSAAAVRLPDRDLAIHEGDRVIWTRAQPIRGQARIETGVRGSVIEVGPERQQLRVRLDGSDREVTVGSDDLDAVGLSYAATTYRLQGATIERAIAVTGGWQTSRESAYVQASRARAGIEWHVARDELSGEEDAAQVDQLAARMRLSRAQVPSLAYPTRTAGLDPDALDREISVQPERDPGVEIR
jgi:ATP-dependent exoDNAse (exonuclease V) alpha subunit